MAKKQGRPPTMSSERSARYLIEVGGGETSESLFVQQPGVVVLSTRQQQGGGEPEIIIGDTAMQLFRQLHLYTEQDPQRLLAEIAARVTYLSFPAGEASEQESNRFHNMLGTLGHSSPYNLANEPVIVLATGWTVETMFELVANKLRIGRTSSSRTTVMNVVWSEGAEATQKRKSPFYRVYGNTYFRKQLEARLRDAITRHAGFAYGIDMKKAGYAGTRLARQAGQEHINTAQPGNKAGYAIAGGSPDTWYQKLTKRLSDLGGAELELRLVYARIYHQLRSLYPDIFLSPLQEGLHENALTNEIFQVHGAGKNDRLQEELHEIVEHARQLLQQSKKPTDLTVYEEGLPGHREEDTDRPYHDPAVLLLAMLLLQDVQNS